MDTAWNQLIYKKILMNSSIYVPNYTILIHKWNSKNTEYKVQD